MEREPEVHVASVTPDTADRVGRRIAAEDIESAVVREALDLWNAKRGARPFPAREDLTPRDMKNFLRHVTLYRMLNDGADFEFRVMGDAAVQAWGRSFVGLNAGGVNRVSPGMGDVMQRICASVTRRGDPLVVRGMLSKEAYEHIDQETIFLPLGPDGATVEHILGVSWYARKAPDTPLR